MKKNKQIDRDVEKWMVKFVTFYDKFSNEYRSYNWNRGFKERAIDTMHELKRQAEKISEGIHYRDNKSEHCLIIYYFAWCDFFVWENHSPVQIFKRLRTLSNLHSINYGKYLLMNCT